MNTYTWKDISSKAILHGRTYEDSENGILYFNWTCSGIEILFRGTCLIASLAAYAGPEMERNPLTGEVTYRPTWPWMAVFLDGEEEPTRKFEVFHPEEDQLIFHSEKVETHRIRIVKLTENMKTGLGLIRFYAEGEILAGDFSEEENKKRKIEFIGDSITCGFGNETKDRDRLFYSVDENGWMSHAAIAARKLGMKWSMVSISGICVSYRSAIPLIGMEELYPYTDRVLEERMGKKEYTPWDFEKEDADYVVVNLGTNDATGIMGAEDPKREEEKFHEQYKEFIRNIRRLHRTDTKIICALGSMDYYLYEHICEIVKEYQEESKDESIYCFRYPKIHFMDPFGACAHPHVITQKKMGEAIADFIRTIDTCE